MPEIEAGGDNTQRLLTTLGRFHRYVAKGQSGAPQQFWSDDSMTQLITGLELAAVEGWDNLSEALTGTARILQSYENGQSANMAIPFLNESYEMLCLMVGDLIVNNERSGVMSKWRDRYSQAVLDLQRAGLALVEDDSYDEAAAHNASADLTPVMMPLSPPSIPEESTPFVTAEAEMPHEEEAAATDDVSDLPPVDLPFLMPADVPEDDPWASAAMTPLERIAQSQAERECALVPAPVTEDAADDAQCVSTDVEPGREPAVVAALDLLCEELSHSNVEDADERGAHLSALIETVACLREHANEHGREASAQACERMKDVCQLVAETRQPLDDRFLDIAYAFCDVYVQAIDSDNSTSVETWFMDVDDLCGTLRLGLLSAAEPVEAVDVEPDVTAALPEEVEAQDVTQPEDPVEAGTAESLLANAQSAIAHGDVSNAKTLALQAVAELARREALKAEQRVRDAETRFRENTESIEREREIVREAEQGVVTAESQVREALARLESSKNATAAATEKVSDAEQRIAEIEDEIRALEAKRDEERARADDARMELAEAHDEEVRGEAELNQSRDAESAARAELENARQTVKDLQRKQTELEEALGRAHESLVHYHSSLSDIDRTIHQLSPQAEQRPANGDMLF